MKYISIDTETLGLHPSTSDIIEFGAVIDDLNNPKPKERCPKLRVFFEKKQYVGQIGAMAMHGDLFKEIKDFPYSATEARSLYDQTVAIRLEELGTLFHNWHESFGIEGTPTVAGKNYAMFDHRWLDGVIKVRHRVLDVGSLFFDPKVDDVLPNLKTCLARAGINKTIAHTSVDDAWDVIECVRAYYSNKE